MKRGEGGITFSYIVASSSPLPPLLFTPHTPEKSDNQVTVTGDVSNLLEWGGTEDYFRSCFWLFMLKERTRYKDSLDVTKNLPNISHNKLIEAKSPFLNNFLFLWTNSRTDQVNKSETASTEADVNSKPLDIAIFWWSDHLKNAELAHEQFAFFFKDS